MRLISFVSLALLAGFPAMAQAQELGNADRGLAYARKQCATCHAVMPGQRASPSRDAAPFSVIANAPGMTELALSVWFRTPHKAMPNLIIEPSDRDDLIAYITSLKANAPAK